MIKSCETTQDFDRLLALSHEKPVFLFKHSTRCPISAGRWRVLQGFAEQEPRADFYRLLVIEDRSLSLDVAQKTGVRHQSPQILLFYDGKVVWDTSHGAITEEAMRSALDRIGYR